MSNLQRPFAKCMRDLVQDIFNNRVTITDPVICGRRRLYHQLVLQTHALSHDCNKNSVSAYAIMYLGTVLML